MYATNHGEEIDLHILGKSIGLECSERFQVDTSRAINQPVKVIRKVQIACIILYSIEGEVGASGRNIFGGSRGDPYLVIGHQHGGSGCTYPIGSPNK